jgi:hypothetical protein
MMEGAQLDEGFVQSRSKRVSLRKGRSRMSLDGLLVSFERMARHKQSLKPTNAIYLPTTQYDSMLKGSQLHYFVPIYSQNFVNT